MLTILVYVYNQLQCRSPFEQYSSFCTSFSLWIIRNFSLFSCLSYLYDFCIHHSDFTTADSVNKTNIQSDIILFFNYVKWSCIPHWIKFLTRKFVYLILKNKSYIETTKIGAFVKTCLRKKIEKMILFILWCSSEQFSFENFFKIS